MTEYDAIVVGSGATGAMAAQTLIERGASVLMIDGGQSDRDYAGLVPDANFVDIRQTDNRQFRYMLGDAFEGVASGDVATGSQLTPPRRFITEGVSRFLPFASETFKPLESLALGGLGSGWGLGCCVFSDAELADASLPAGEMRAAYQIVADRIGISGAADDARPYTTAHLQGIQPSQPIDETAAVLQRRYERQRQRIQARGFHAGRPGMALLTRDLDDRRPTRLNDMEFYSDAGLSAWRPWIAVQRLRQSPRFRYEGGFVVTHVEESLDTAGVRALAMQHGGSRSFSAKRVVLATGALGTARIVLRSQSGGTGAAVAPLLCNPYSYLPCIVPSRLGKAMRKENISLCQLALFHDPDGTQRDVAMAFVYTYRALMMYRIVQQLPLDLQSARTLFQYAMSSFVIVGIHHPHRYNPRNSLLLEADPASPTGDRMVGHFELDAAERLAVRARERAYASVLRSLGAIAVKRVDPGFGSSIHYAGTVPIGASGPIGMDVTGRLNGRQRVYVADGSGFTYLPAKGLTLSLMANAHRVASQLPIEP